MSDSSPHSEQLGYLREMVERLVSMIDPDVISDVRGPEGQHEGEYRLWRIRDDMLDGLANLEEQLDAAHEALQRIYWHARTQAGIEEVIISVISPEQRAAWKKAQDSSPASGYEGA